MPLAPQAQGGAQASQATPEGGAWSFYSPNTDTNLNFKSAYQRLNSSNQKAFREISQDVLNTAGIKDAELHDAIGDWDDPTYGGGAENSIVQVLRKPPDPETTKYLAAWHGLLGNQKAVYHFVADPKGPDSLYQIFVPEPSGDKVRELLSSYGIRERTIVPTKSGNFVLIGDAGRKLRPNVEQLAESIDATVRETAGHGECIGADTRTAARSKFRQIIRTYERSKVHSDTGTSNAPPAQPPTKPASLYQGQAKSKRRIRFAGLTLNQDVLSNAQSYKPDYEGVSDYVPVNQDRAQRIAAYYEQAQHSPQDPKVKSSYDAFKKETLAQYKHLAGRGVNFEPWTKEGQPYANSAEMLADVRNHRHLYFYTGGEFPKDHPLAETSGLSHNGQALSYNDLFRAVHDYYGHALYGNQFGPRGEEHAWRTHSRMYSPEAQPAMGFETRGQNSWVNFGPSSHLPVTERPYAEQKANVLSPELMEETPIKMASRKSPEGGYVWRGIFYPGGKFIPEPTDPVVKTDLKRNARSTPLRESQHPALHKFDDQFSRALLKCMTNKVNFSATRRPIWETSDYSEPEQAPYIHWNNWDARLGTKDFRKVGNNTYLERLGPDEIGLRLHGTHIIKAHRNGPVTLYTRGFKTVTTKARMNDWLPKGVRVHANNYQWYVTKNGTQAPFSEGMDVDRDEGFEPIPQPRQRKAPPATPLFDTPNV